MQVEVRELHPDPKRAAQVPNPEHFLFSLCDMVQGPGTSAGSSHWHCGANQPAPDVQEHEQLWASHESRSADACTYRTRGSSQALDSKRPAPEYLKALTLALNSGVCVPTCAHQSNLLYAD